MRMSKCSTRLTSRLNSTPPIGEPKATEMPDAAAAENISLLRAMKHEVSNQASKQAGKCARARSTFILVDIAKQLDEQVRTAAGNMDKGTFLSKPHSR